MAKKKEEEKTVEGEKKSALELAIGAINKKYGAGSIFTSSDTPIAIDTISSGCMSLDNALGDGFARGRIVEIYGGFSSGKTTVALHTIKETQRLGEKAAFIDAEHALDVLYAKNIGLCIEDLLICQPNSGEQALNVVDTLIRSGEVSTIVVDSVANLVPQAELEGEIGENKIGLQARLMSQALRKFTSILAETNTLLIFINQIRLKIGILFGNPETTTSGEALKFYSSQRLEMRSKGPIGEGEKIGIKTKAKVVKNKIAAPYKETEFSILFGSGVDFVGDLFQTATDKGIITKDKNTYLIGENKLAVGEGAAIEALRASPDFQKQILDKLSASRHNK